MITEYIVLARSLNNEEEEVLSFEDLAEAQSYKKELDSAKYRIVKRITTIEDEYL
jgi:hypothetical protein